MYYICNKKTGTLLSHSYILEFEQNTNNKEYVYIDDYVIIWKNDDFDYTWLPEIHTGELHISPLPVILSDKQIEEAELIKLREDLIKKASELIAEKKKEVSENRDIGYLTEKFRIAKNILGKTADNDDTNDFETEVQLRGRGETKDELAKKVKRKYKEMYRRMTKLDVFYFRFLRRTEKRNNIDNINKGFERFKEELKEQVKR